VTSLRKVDWDSFRVNFFALFPPGPLECHAGHLYLGVSRTSVQQCVVARAGAKISEHSRVDIGEIVRQVQGIMDSVSRAVEFVFLFTLAAAFWYCGGDRRDAGRAQVRRRRFCARSAHRIGNW